MQSTQRSDNNIQRRCLALAGTLALVLGTGCEPLSSSAEMRSDSAPLIVARQDVRIPGEYVVVFADEVARGSIESAASRIEGAGGNNGIMYRYAVIPGFAARLDDAALAGLRRNPLVAYVAENQQVQLYTTFPSPADGIDRTDQRLGRDGMYDDHGRTGAGVHVYIIDTGIYAQHGEFTGRIGAGFTAIADGRGTEDCHGHGTHVSSTAAGTTYGMAKQATIHPVRVLDCSGSGSFAGVIAGVDFVRNDCPTQGGRCVANMSLGGGYYAPVNQAVANAVNSGVTVVVAAGNNNGDACNTSPASEPKAITTAAIDDADQRAWFSNWGTCVDIFAPGVTIRGAALGSPTAWREDMNGTSMASPHVAGAAAQYLSSNPGATPAQVEANIKGAASLDCVTDPMGSPNVLLFNDLSQGNYTCSNEQASCEGLCGGVGNGCYCDPACVTYGDCCHDYADFCL